MSQNDVLDKMSRLLFDMFVDSMDVPIPGKKMLTSQSGCSKQRCNPSSKGRITRSTSRPKKEDICTIGNGNDDNNDRTKWTKGTHRRRVNDPQQRCVTSNSKS
jgi:Tfp pilus assembly major pilin PilA